MADNSPLLSLPYLLPSQAQKHVTHNQALDLLDFLVQPVAEAVDALVPPDAPEEGRLWALGAPAEGAWQGQDLTLASWRNGAWLHLMPQPGWTVFSRADNALLSYDGGGWQGIGGAVIESGSNDNGGWQRFADGRLQCWQSALQVAAINSAEGALWRSEDLEWLFPQGFAEPPVLSGGGADLGCWLSLGAPTQTACSLRLMSALSRDSAVGLRLIASGRAG
jgi:hypothetical protein